MNIALIPARGGSKRIPKKNIKNFKGKPIIAYAIDAALKSGIFERVVVSTDDEEISKVALQYGAEVPFIRSKTASDDYATLHDVAIDFYNKLNIDESITCCLILATNPLLKIETINKAFDLFANSKFDSVMTLTPSQKSSQRIITLKDNTISMSQSQASLKRTQDQEQEYFDAGQLYLFKLEELKKRNRLIGSNCGAVVLNNLECQDIDSLEDWALAEFKFSYLETNK